MFYWKRIFPILQLEEFLLFSQEKKHTLQNNPPLGIVTNTESYLMIWHTKILGLLKISWVENNLLSMLSPRIYLHRQLIWILRYHQQPRNLAFTCFQIYLNQNKTHLGSIQPGQELIMKLNLFFKMYECKGRGPRLQLLYGSVQSQNGRAGNGLQV